MQSITLNDLLFNLESVPGFTAGLDFDAVAAWTGDTDRILAPTQPLFTNLAAGLGAPFDVKLLLDQVGSFSATYLLSFSDGDLYLGAGAPGSQELQLTLTAMVRDVGGPGTGGDAIPEPATAVLAWLTIAVGLHAGTRRTRR
jgi:hypothetical protein